MRPIVLILAFLITGSIVCDVAVARRRIRLRARPTTPAMLEGTDQERAQAEADYMAANGYRGHVGPSIGHFEGVGWGKAENCPTCSPRRRMTLTADATAKSSTGRTYRVRAWRWATKGK